MKHEEARDLLADYALDLIDRDSQVDIAGHIDQCEVCHAELRLYGQAARALATLAARQPSRITTLLEPRPLTAEEAGRITARARGLEPLPRPRVPIPVGANGTVADGKATPPSRRSRWGLFGRSHRGDSVPPVRDDDFGTDSFAGLFAPVGPEAHTTGEAPALLAEAAAASAPPQPREAPQKAVDLPPAIAPAEAFAPSHEPAPETADVSGAPADEDKGPQGDQAVATPGDAPIAVPSEPTPESEAQTPAVEPTVALAAVEGEVVAEAADAEPVPVAAIIEAPAVFAPIFGDMEAPAQAPELSTDAPSPAAPETAAAAPREAVEGLAAGPSESPSGDDFGDPFAPGADELPATPPSRRGRRFIGRDRRPETKAPRAPAPQPAVEPVPPPEQSPRTSAPPPAGRRRFLGRRREPRGAGSAAGDDFATDSFAGLFDEPAFDDGSPPAAEPALVLDRHAGDGSSDTFDDLFAESVATPVPQPQAIAVRTGRGWITATILFALVTAGLVAGGVVGFFVLTDYRNDNAELESKQQVLAMQIGFTGENDIQGIAYLESPDYTRGFLRLDNLPIPPKGQAYVLWADSAAGLQMIREVRVTRDERLYLDLTRLPKNLSRLFFTEEEQGFRGKEPNGRVVATGVPPFVP